METVIETLILQALAEPEGYVRMFVDEGAAMAALLSPLIANCQPTTAHYARTLLEALTPPVAARRLPSAVESLSDRELQVLRLIAEGYSTREVAEELVITVTTVKKHVSNIFGKLGVTSRTQAIARAREAHLT